MKTTVFDDRQCRLGEGPLWHPTRKQLFWFDIPQKKMMSKTTLGALEWQFEETVTAAGWVDSDTLLIASESGLWRLNLTNEDRQMICPLEQDNPITRSNDGRADPWGGFWIGTMGYNAETGAGAIYRYYRSTLRKVVDDITISNAICFAPDKSCAYYTDTPTGKIMKLPLDSDGWPKDAPSIFVDLKDQGLNPDGALVDAEGTVWVALWGASKVAAFNAAGHFLRDVSLPANQPTCPAFGGDYFSTLFVTSAAQGLDAEQTQEVDQRGMTFAIDGLSTGLAEPRVQL